MSSVCQSLPRGSVRLAGGILADRFRLNRAYVASLKNENLLQAYLLEAGLTQYMIRNTHNGGTDQGEHRHWGWESPSCQVRGHFLGHWLSAAAQIWAATGDAEIKLKADAAVSELARCQRKNGGEWVSPIPEKYMAWLAQGTPTWAPQYVHHKTLMGLHDMAALAGSEEALQIAGRFADWFLRWSAGFSREQMDNILDVETGGMLEAWANLYGATGDEKYLDLIGRYDRRRLFEPLLEGRDVLTNRHANTTIPEAQGAARCYEVTGDERWRRIAEAYWRCAVTERGAFCTGGQTSGEIWTPPYAFAARRGDKNQEHCTVYNMIRLAEYLFRWSGDPVYLDTIERNLYNGILAQQNPRTGMISYFLPLEAGARKIWGSPTNDFWCCHGSLVQAHAMHDALLAYRDAEGFRVAQYVPSEVKSEWKGVPVTLRIERADAPGEPPAHQPRAWVFRVSVTCEAPAEFTLSLRLPAWLDGKARLWLNGEPLPLNAAVPGFACVRRAWQEDTLMIELPKALAAESIPDEPDTVAFLDGPVVLAGLCDHEVTLVGDHLDPSSMLAPDNEREWGNWLNGYRTVGQPTSIRFRPLHEVVDEAYTLYFPIRPA